MNRKVVRGVWEREEVGGKRVVGRGVWKAGSGNRGVGRGEHEMESGKRGVGKGIYLYEWE